MPGEECRFWLAPPWPQAPAQRVQGGQIAVDQLGGHPQASAVVTGTWQTGTLAAAAYTDLPGFVVSLRPGVGPVPKLTEVAAVAGNTLIGSGHDAADSSSMSLTCCLGWPNGT